MLTDWKTGLDVEDLHGEVFAGKILRIKLPEVDEIVVRTRAIAEDAFGRIDPQSAEQNMDADAYREAVKKARLTANADVGVNEAWHSLLSAIGFDLDDTYGDRLRLRIVPSQSTHHGLRHQPLPPHRDSWGSGFEAQVNWWMPLYPLSASRTMVVWPEAFNKPIENDSGIWSLENFQRAQAAGEPYPLLPSTSVDYHDQPAQPITVEPGEILAFSASHLHASTSDNSGISRFSMDTRTLRRSDVCAERGAPNTDNALKERQYQWFKRASDGLEMAAVPE